MAMPQARAKNITASMPFPLELPSSAPTISCNGFSGSMSSKVSAIGLRFLDCLTLACRLLGVLLLDPLALLRRQ